MYVKALFIKLAFCTTYKTFYMVYCLGQSKRIDLLNKNYNFAVIIFLQILTKINAQLSTQHDALCVNTKVRPSLGLIILQLNLQLPYFFSMINSHDVVHSFSEQVHLLFGKTQTSKVALLCRLTKNLNLKCRQTTILYGFHCVIAAENFG